MKRSHPSFLKRAVYALSGIAVIGLVLATWAFVIEPSHVRIKEHKIYIKNWPANLAGFSIAFLTDPHVGGVHVSLSKMQKLVEQTNALNPDLTLLGGDYVIQGVLGGQPVPSQEIVNVLGQLKAKYGIFGILGNHDWWENGPTMTEQFAQQNIPMLENTARPLQIRGTDIWLVGVSDFSENQQDVAKAFAGVPTSAPVLVLTHSPDVFPELPSHAALTFAGHTHGGQVYVPFVGRPIVPSKYGERYALGLITEGAKQLFVGSGIGTSILPVRFLTPPEISLLKIYPAQP